MSACAFALQAFENRKAKIENRNSKLENRNSKLEIRNSLRFSPSADGFGLPISAFRRVPSRKLEIPNSLRFSNFEFRFSNFDFRFSNFDFRPFRVSALTRVVAGPHRAPRRLPRKH